MKASLLGCPNRKLKGKGWWRGWKCLLAVSLRRTLWKKDAWLKIQEQQRTLQAPLVARILCPLTQYYGVFFSPRFALHSGTSLFLFFLSSVAFLLYMSLPVFFFFLTNSLCRAVFSPNMLILVVERNVMRCSRDILAAGDLKSALVQGKMWAAYL